jgi:hypothetical protein
MELQLSSIKSRFFFLSILSFFAFGAGFTISYQQDQIHVLELGQIIESHLNYALEMKDDMAMIDWSKNLEKLNHILAYRAFVNSKVAVEGGNRNLISGDIVEGISYKFPSDWVFRQAFHGTPQASQEMVFYYHSPTGPFRWGFLNFIVCYLTGGLVWFFAPKGKIAVPNPGSKIEKKKNQPIQTLDVKPTPINSPPGSKPFLFLDKNYVIQQISYEAAQILNKEFSTLDKRHFVELQPDPKLMAAIDKAEAGKFSNPFLDHSDLTVSVKPELNGTILFFEPSEKVEPLQKH